MTPDRWQRVDRILNEALDQPQSERQSYVQKQCQNDPTLLSQVNTLLAAYDESQDWCELPSLTPDQKLGAYRILREIGRGGMGIVYLAERDDDQFQKRVAIKVLASTLASGELVRRFRDERRILARLEHPNLARLIDAGVSAGGLRYIVMEFVDGQPLHHYCSERHLGEREQLRLFQQVCSVVQLAHRNLIVHRDIKPGNILVTREGIPKLLDFGIAKILDPAEGPREATVMRAMTPEYASPEQLTGRPITTASDIYSLGILLRKLLAIEVINADLAAIITKATRDEPEERYASADELAADIDRYCSGLPVMARNRSTRYVVQKFVRRNPVGVSAALLAAVLAMAGVIGILYESRIAERESAKAQLRFNQVRKLARSLMYELHDGVAELPGSTAVRALLVRRSLEYLDALFQEGENEDGLQQELADAYQRVGSVQGKVGASNLGDVAGAFSSYGKARSILAGLISRKPDDLKVQTSLASVLRELSGLQKSTGDPQALPTAQEALGLGEQAYLRHPGDDSARFARAAGYFQLAIVVDGEERKRAAWMQALPVYEADLARKPTDSNAIRNVALVHKYLVTEAMEKPRNLADALRHGEMARELDERRLALNPASREARLDLTFDLSQIAFVLSEKGDLPAALINYQKVDEMRQELVRGDPRDAHLKQRSAFGKLNVGEVLLKLNRPHDAAAKFEEALAILESFPNQGKADQENTRLKALIHTCLGVAQARQPLEKDCGAPVAKRR